MVNMVSLRFRYAISNTFRCRFVAIACVENSRMVSLFREAKETLMPTGNKSQQNHMFRFLASHLLVGLATGWAILAIFIGFDFGGLRSLATLNHLEFLVYPLLAVFFAITFGGAAMGIGIMSMKNDQKTPKGKPIRIEPITGLAAMQIAK